MTQEQQEEVERDISLYVSEKFESWRDPWRYKIAYGGRGAGAKSWNAASLLCQFAETPDYFGEKIRVLCVREVQNAVEESSYRLIKDTVKRLGFDGWTLGKTTITNVKNGSYFVYRGLNELSVTDLKSYEGFNILFIEEGAFLTDNIMDTVFPTFRKKGSEIWILFNRELERDPVYDRFCVTPPANACVISCQPMAEDNEWWYDTELPALAEEMRLKDPDAYEHVFLGAPRRQGENSIMSRVAIREAMDRRIDNPEGVIEIGVDVARFGDDSTQMYKRHGLKVIGHDEMRKAGTIEVARKIWEFAGHSQTNLIKIDEGYNPGVVDVLREYGANVVGINFGGSPSDRDQYTNIADELWFTFPLDIVQIPDDNELMSELSDRRYEYERGTNRKKVEPKDKYKRRNGGKSPDKADALLLAFYSPGTAFDAETRDFMRRLREERGGTR